MDQTGLCFLAIAAVSFVIGTITYYAGYYKGYDAGIGYAIKRVKEDINHDYR